MMKKYPEHKKWKSAVTAEHYDVKSWTITKASQADYAMDHFGRVRSGGAKTTVGAEFGKSLDWLLREKGRSDPALMLACWRRRASAESGKSLGHGCDITHVGTTLYSTRRGR